MTEAGYHSPRMLSLAAHRVQENMKAVRDRRGTPMPSAASPPPMVARRAASTVPMRQARGRGPSPAPLTQEAIYGEPIDSPRPEVAQSIWCVALRDSAALGV
jgi:hypothetical protein